MPPSESISTTVHGSRGDFVPVLESVRGVAALAVVLFHSFHLVRIDGDTVFHRTIGKIDSLDVFALRISTVVFNGGAAVSMFFVLSGFVLALSLRRDPRSLVDKTPAFVARRFLRIYPALAINVLLIAGVISAIVYLFPLAPLPHFSQSQVVANLFLRDFTVNGASWSLLVEIAAIPFLLFGHWVTQRWGLAGISILVAAAVVVLFAPQLLFKFLIASYLFMFYLGMLVAEIPLKQRLVKTQGRVAIFCFWLSLFGLFSARFLLGYVSRWSLLIEGVASALIILNLLGPKRRIHRWLEAKSASFLGRISYSYYLYHPLALFLIAPFLLAPEGLRDPHPLLTATVLAILTVVTTLPIAYASFRWVEQPIMRLGRKYGKRFGS